MGIVRTPGFASHTTGGKVVHARLDTLIAQIVVGAESKQHMRCQLTEVLYKMGHFIDTSP